MHAFARLTYLEAYSSADTALLLMDQSLPANMQVGRGYSLYGRKLFESMCVTVTASSLLQCYLIYTYIDGA
jgi:hypothetical protein